MSFGHPSGAALRRGGGGAKAQAGGVGRSDVQERLRELRTRQDAWMQQRERSLEPAAPHAQAPDSDADSEPRKPPRPHPRLQPQSQLQAAPATAPLPTGPSGLLERVRLELDDIEREVRASAGLPTAMAPSAALNLSLRSTASAAAPPPHAAAAKAPGLRPISHFCPACGRLMLGEARAPHLLAPCGHSVCAKCAPRTAESGPPLRCPHCGLRVSACRPDSALRSAVGAFAGGGGGPSGTSASSSAAAASAAAAGRWLQQLEVISGRMRQLDATMEGLQAEVAQLTGQLEAEAARDRQLAGAETAARKEVERLQAELRSLSEMRAVSRDNQAFIQSEIDAKKQAIQGAFASQQLVSQELAKLQTICAD